MKSKENIKEKYVHKFLKLTILVTIICILPGLLTLGMMIIEGEYSLVIIWLFCPVIIAVIISPLYIIRFNRLINHQEKMFDIKFDDCNAKDLGNKITFISDNWLIHSGSCAFYRDYVKSFGLKTKISRLGTDYKIIINTIDGKNYHFHAWESKVIGLCRAWLHRKEIN